MSSQPLASPSRSIRNPGLRQSHLILLLGFSLIMALIFLDKFVFQFGPFPESWNLHLREPIDEFKLWVIRNRNTHPLFAWIFKPFSDLVEFSLRRLENLLLWFPWPVIILGVFLFTQKTANLRLGLLAALSLFFMGLLGLWTESMQTLALMTIAVLLSLSIGIPLGIWAAYNRRIKAVLRPFLDAMQTMPAFVYLIPVLLFFGVARVPSVVATVIYAVPPAIRLTTLGIRQVPSETIEAAQAFGSTPRQILWKVQLPLALPSIMVGVNQTIMMALGIVVIAALIGAGGLGKAVLDSLRSLKVGQALEAGLAIVLMAILLDRLSYALAQSANRHTPLGEPKHRLFPSHWEYFSVVQIVETSVQGLYRVGGKLSSAVITLLKQILNVGQRLWGQTLSQYLQGRLLRLAYPLMALLSLWVVLLISFSLAQTGFPKAWRVPFYQPVDNLVRWVRDNLYEFQLGGVTVGTGPLSDAIIIYLLDPLDTLFQVWLAWPVIILLIALLGYAVSGWRLGLFSSGITLLIGFLGMWEPALVTLSQVVVAVGLALTIALPVGVWAAQSKRVAMLLRPILDTLQTIPTFVYLVPVIMLFSVGRVPGIMASILYALPPAIRLTNLGIREANPEAVEAALAFGSTKWQTLLKVQLPLAMPSIMMGINQTIMMVLAMVVIAGMVGGAGLGLEAVNGLARSEMGRGIEAGLAIVVMAVVMDRLMQAWAKKYEQGLES